MHQNVNIHGKDNRRSTSNDTYSDWGYYYHVMGIYDEDGEIPTHDNDDYYYESESSNETVNVTQQQTEISVKVHNHAPLSARAILALLVLISGLYLLYLAWPYRQIIGLALAAACVLTVTGLFVRFIALPVVGSILALAEKHNRRLAQPHEQPRFYQPRHKQEVECYVSYDQPRKRGEL